MLTVWGRSRLMLMRSDFYFQAEQGKIAAEEEDIGEDSQFMMLAKKVTAKALQKNGELSSSSGPSLLDGSCRSLGSDSSLRDCCPVGRGLGLTLC